jgi:integrase
MLRPNSRGQTVDEQIVVAQHLHQRVLDELAGAPGREQRRPVRLPGIPDRVTAGSSLRIERKMESPLRERLRVLTMIESGARAAELRGLQLGDFDLYRKTVVVTGKGSKRRLIPVSAELAATVDEYMLTAYPLLERLPAATDYLWYAV